MDYFEYNANAAAPKTEQDNERREDKRSDTRSEYDANRELRDTILFIARVRLN